MRTVCELLTGHSHLATPDAQTALVVRKRLRESATAARTAHETGTNLIAAAILAQGPTADDFEAIDDNKKLREVVRSARRWDAGKRRRVDPGDAPNYDSLQSLKIPNELLE